MRATTRDRLFDWLLGLLVVAGVFFGLAPFLAPTQFASATGFAGTDLFMYRLAGAATFGYGVGLAVGYRAGWESLRIPIAATAVFNGASILACLVAIASGPQPIVFVILAASILFTAGTTMFLMQPPAGRVAGPGAPATSPPDLATWVVALFVIGAIAAAFFGLAPLLLGGGFGKLLGYSGADDFVYRQGAAATLGAAAGAVLVLRSRRWSAARIPAIMATTFNGLATAAAVVELANGGQPIAWLILGAAGVTTVGMLGALVRGGR